MRKCGKITCEHPSLTCTQCLADLGAESVTTNETGNMLLSAGWRDIKKELPERSGLYIVCLKNNVIFDMQFYKYNGKPYWYKNGFSRENPDNPVIYWMPLPVPPSCR